MLTISSDKARAQWRDIIDKAAVGENVVVERYGKPMVAIIAYEDFLELQDMLDDLRDAREAEAILEAWRRDPTIARPWEEVKQELMADGEG